MQRFAMGKSTRQIARELGTSERQVKTHLSCGSHAVFGIEPTGSLARAKYREIRRRNPRVLY